MGRPKSVPAYTHHKPRDCARVRIDGKPYYLPGRYGSAESRAAYDRLIAEHMTARALGGPQAPRGVAVTVAEMLLRYREHALKHYRGPDGRPTDEVKNLGDALSPVRVLYGDTPAAEFGPLALEAVRSEMIRVGLARTTINARVHRIRRAFRWAVARELVPPSVVAALDAVAALLLFRKVKPCHEVVPGINVPA
jgi:hypothetical protein